MSKAFVRDDGADATPELPARPVSEHPNFVTAAGLAQIEEQIARLQTAQAKAQQSEDRTALAETARDLRYWAERRANAELIPPPADHSQVRFGVTVSIRRDDGREQTFQIVGEDEAEPSRGKLSYVSPVARALTGKEVGDVAKAGAGEAEILKIS